MDFPKLFHVANYQEMLWKLAVFLALEVYGATWFVRHSRPIEEFHDLLINVVPINAIHQYAPLSANFNLTGAAIALMIGACSYAFKLHDRLSDVLRIRRRFDLDNIILPLFV